MTDRFTLEENIMECWGVTENLKLLVSTEFQASDEDTKANIILGLISLYDIKFQILQTTMETLVAEGDLT